MHVLLEQLYEDLENQLIDSLFTVSAPDEEGEYKIANIFNYTDEYEEAEVEPYDGYPALTIHNLIQSLRSVPDNTEVFVWEPSEGGKMIPSRSYNIDAANKTILLY